MINQVAAEIEITGVNQGEIAGVLATRNPLEPQTTTHHFITASATFTVTASENKVGHFRGKHCSETCIILTAWS